MLGIALTNLHPHRCFSAHGASAHPSAWLQCLQSWGRRRFAPSCCASPPPSTCTVPTRCDLFLRPSCDLSGLQWFKHVAPGGLESKLLGSQLACACLSSTSAPACPCRRRFLLRPRQKGSAGTVRRSACCAASGRKGAPGMCSTAVCLLLHGMPHAHALCCAGCDMLCSALFPLGAMRLTPVCCAPPPAMQRQSRHRPRQGGIGVQQPVQAVHGGGTGGGMSQR